jgi:hypothetical protein
MMISDFGFRIADWEKAQGSGRKAQGDLGCEMWDVKFGISNFELWNF